jgi:hypothetical protein
MTLTIKNKPSKKTVVIDTNVVVVANKQSPQASSDCIATCEKRLYNVRESYGRLAIDSKWRIIGEYQRYLNLGQQPRPGDLFVKWVLSNVRDEDAIDSINITPIDSDPANFHEFPQVPELSGFDPSDRKFVAVAMVHPEHPSILQAVDSLWWGFKDALERNGVNVEFICESDIQNLYDQRLGR